MGVIIRDIPCTKIKPTYYPFYSKIKIGLNITIKCIKLKPNNNNKKKCRREV